MGVIPRLFEIYRRQGFVPVSGLNPAQWHGFPLAPFTWLFRDGRNHTQDLGISLHELAFLAALFGEFQPRSVFIVGNACGWSAVAIALMLPRARVLALDAADNEITRDGLAMTNRIAAEEGLDLVAVAGLSPGDVAASAAAHLAVPPDLLFVDGLHTNDQVVLDFRALAAVAAPRALYLFHDVHEFDLYEGLGRIREESGLRFRRLLATPSGIAALYPDGLEATVGPLLAAYGPDEAALSSMERMALAWRNRRSRVRKLRRSLVKRANWLRDRLGQPPRELPP